MKTHCIVDDQRGFTLTEVMISVVVLLISVVSLVEFSSWLNKASAFTERMAAAESLAEEKLEHLIAQKYSRVLDGTDSTSSYSRAWTVVETNGLKIVNVTVEWTDLQGTTRDVTLQSFLEKQ